MRNVRGLSLSSGWEDKQQISPGPSSARDLLLIHCPSGIVPRPADFLLGIPGPAGVPPLSSVEFGEGALGGEGAVSPVSPGLSFLSSLGRSSQHPLCCRILSPL